MENIAFLNMLQCFDAFFPIGTFTLSNGLESYVQKNVVNSISSLDEYIESYLQILPNNDLGFMYNAYSGTDIIQLDEIVSAIKSPKEIRNGSMKLCKRFIKIQDMIKQNEKLDQYSNLINSGECDGHHSIALGLYVCDINMPIDEALTMYVYSIVSTIVNNAVKLVPLSQMQGQKLLNKYFPKIDEVVKKAKNITVDDLGIAGVGFDIKAMQHEKLYTRLYIS